ncbi:MAG: class I SAM-dependent RNA methyltransferase [Pyrinomonadaceae bacterium]|nr:class I SAM-dependent RNA methyltransferase [Pyrinomonadaceae bacterium]MBP6213827.1 class I SAM-dependent RNA methyltransferase [Pyrinomonadaceae bacterium]
MSTKYEVGEILDLRIEKIVPRGLGLAFAEDLTVFVPLAAPGDDVRAKITQVKRRTAFADIVEVIEKSPNRIDPPCRHFGTCGGCDFQQLDYRTQLSSKVAIIGDCIERIGKIRFEREIDIIPSPDEFGYRSRAKWHLDRETKAIGYFKRDSHEVVDVAVCPILTPGLQSALDLLRDKIEWDMVWNSSAEIEAASDGENISVFSNDMAEPTIDISVQAAGETFSFSARSFFQANHSLIDKLVETALGDSRGRTALDLYCGVGLFALPMARRFEQVIGVEGNNAAIDFAERNAKNAGLDNLRFVREGVDKFLYGHDLAGTDFVLLDPPRAGTEKFTIGNIIKLEPKEIAYVSCEPSILARDLAQLIAGGYKIDTITALDMFPQTHHVETVVRLSAN